jgi:hypothetical protein
MKKLTIFVSIIALWVFLLSPSAYAAPKFATLDDVQNAIVIALGTINTTINNIQSTLTSLASSISNMQAKINTYETNESTQSSDIALLSTKIKTLEEKIADLENMDTPDFQLVNTEAKYTQTDANKYILSISTDAEWKGQPISFYQVFARGTFHLPSGDSDFIVPTSSNSYNQVEFLNGPVTIPVDLWVFWQGTTRHVQRNILIP